MTIVLLCVTKLGLRNEEKMRESRLGHAGMTIVLFCVTKLGLGNEEKFFLGRIKFFY